MATIQRTEPTVIRSGRPITTPYKSRLPTPLRIGILVFVNFALRGVLWSFAETLLNPELGAISRIPDDRSFFAPSFYSPGARLGMAAATNYVNWYLNYDFYDVAALTILTNAPYAYLLATYFEISALTIFAHTAVEVLAIAIPTFLLRPRSLKNSANAPLRNRFLLNSVQVQFSNSLLAMGVYVVVLWAGMKTDRLNLFMISHFDVPTLETAHLENPVTMAAKVLIAGVAAKEFLLNPSIAAQPRSGAETPVEVFDPATATLDETFKANVLPKEKRTRTLLQQVLILNAFTFASSVQRCMTIDGTEYYGAAGYAGVWVLANTVIALWYSWVGDTSTAYEPL